MKKGIDAMLKSLDPYTTYIPESEIEDFRFMTTGQYGGIGALITKRGDYVYISEPYEGFPAQKAGLMAGDKILEINGVSAKGKTTEEVSKVLKGQPNTAVSLLVERQNLDKAFQLSFDREKVTVKSVPYSGFVADGIGYIKLRSFTRNCSKDIKDALVALKEEQSLKGLILDLRSNPGGLLNESVNISNIFIEKGEEIVSTKGKIKEWEKVYRATQKAVDTQTPLVVLINQTSASASEIVSGVVQDLDRGVVIGNRSFGKGLVQQSRKLSYNTQLKVTIAKYYTPSGRCIQALDYSNRNEDGSVGKIADSLKTAFKTKNGRTVYDGGGIEPDIKTEKSPISNIAISLIQKRLIFDYATDYRHSNEKIAAAEDYQFSDFEDFKLFLSDKEYEYHTKTEDVVEELKEIAEDELYYESILAEYDALVTKLTANKKDDLNKFKSEIIELLTGEIASRYYYQKGRIIANLQFDEDVQEAIKILLNQEQYNSILAGALDK
jgi:carboxyl-terminal processing protease